MTSKRLGKLSPKHDSRTLRLGVYLDLEVLPSSPASVVPPAVTDWGVMANNRLGDCTCAAAGHQVENWTALEGAFRAVDEAAVVDLYNRVNGGQDNGAYALDVLKEWQKDGLGGDKITAFAKLDTANHDHVRTAIWLFGGAYLGLSLPTTAEAQFDSGSPWTPAGGVPGSWGGHAVNAVGFDDQSITVVTWGRLQRMTWAFWDQYCDEAYATLDETDWTGRVPGFKADQLYADLARVSS